MGTVGDVLEMSANIEYFQPKVHHTRESSERHRLKAD